MAIRREIPVRNFNIAESWESFDVVATEAVGEYTKEFVLPAHSIIERVLAYVISRPLVTTGTAKFKFGSSVDDDGYILEQDISANVRPGNLVHTLFGNDIDELGDLLVTHHIPQDSDYSDKQPIIDTDEALLGNFSSDEVTAVAKITIATTAATSKGQVRVWMKVLTLTVEVS